MNFLSAKNNAQLTYCKCIRRKNNAIISKLNNNIFISTIVQSTALKRSQMIRQNRGKRVFIQVKPLIDVPLRNTF